MYLEAGATVESPGTHLGGAGVVEAARSESDLELLAYAADTIAIADDGRHLRIGANAVAGDDLADADKNAFPAFRQRYLSFVEALAPLIDGTPPRLKNVPFADKKTLARLAWKLRVGLGRDDMYEFLRVVAINIFDVLNEAFEDDRLKGALAAEAVMGSSMGPRTPGTVLTWLQWLSGQRNGPMSLVSAGDSGLVASLTRSAESAGARLRFKSRVERILVANDHVTGIELADGERIEAHRIVSAADPRTTFRNLVGAAQLDAMFAHRVSQIRGSGTTAKLLLGLSDRPAFSELEDDQHGGRLLIAPTMRDVERAFNPSKYGEYPESPVFDITIPSLADASLAPDGQHVLSANVAFVPYAVKIDDDANRQAFVRRLIRILDGYAPGLESRVLAQKFLAPADIEAQTLAVGGHWHHGELSIHQSFMMRPLHGAAQYDTPVGGLFLCSAGCHPGGGLTGLPGRGAARRLLEAGAH